MIHARCRLPLNEERSNLEMALENRDNAAMKVMREKNWGIALALQHSNVKVQYRGRSVVMREQRIPPATVLGQNFPILAPGS